MLRARFVSVVAAGMLLLAAGCAQPPPTAVSPKPPPRPAPEAPPAKGVIFLPTIRNGEQKLAPHTVTLRPGASQRDAIQALLDAKFEGGRIFPAGTKVVSFSASSAGEATLTLSKEIRDYSGGSDQEAAAVNALVLTTVEAYPRTRTVKIRAADGDLETLGGHLDLTEPLEPDRRAVISGS